MPRTSSAGSFLCSAARSARTTGGWMCRRTVPGRDAPAVALEQAVGAVDGQGHDGRPRARGQLEAALLEALQVARLAARALGKDDQRAAGLQVADAAGDGSGRLAQVVAVDDDAAQQLHPGGDDGQAEVLLLGNEALQHGDEADQQRDVEGALVVGDEEHAPAGGQVLQAGDLDPAAGGADHAPGPGAR